MRHERAIVALLLLPLAGLLSGCSAIDDDLSDCPEEDTPDYQLDYELRLVTNMTTELQTELQTQTDVELASALRGFLSNIFTDYAHDVDLSFYDTQGDSLRLQRDQHVMNANQASYTLYLPIRQYMHLAVANLADNALVGLAGDDRCHQARLQQTVADTIDSHSTGLFTARLPMRVLEGVSQSFNVHLYMANCAAALVVDTVGSGIRDLRVVTTGFASGYAVADSSYVFAPVPPIVRTKKVVTAADNRLCFCSVNFPSPESKSTRTIIETTDPFVSSEAAEGLWEFRVYATTATGSVTENKLYVRTPLRAGQLKVIKAQVFANGSTESDDQTVAISVTLDWNKGGTYNPEL